MITQLNVNEGHSIPGMCPNIMTIDSASLNVT